MSMAPGVISPSLVTFPLGSKSSRALLYVSVVQDFNHSGCCLGVEARRASGLTPPPAPPLFSAFDGLESA